MTARHCAAVAAAILLLTLLTFVQFPGHSYLGSDTQIYVPMMEHIWDPSVLASDITANKPHLDYTIYDETAIALRWLTGAQFKTVLIAEQIFFRALELFAVFLIASALPLPPAFALFVTACFSLGATIVGPAVLTIEYEPVPRGFAIPLVLLAIALAARGHMVWSGIAASFAFLFHPPTAASFWLVFIILAIARKQWRPLIPLGIAAFAMFLFVHWQAGPAEKPEFFSRIGPELEKLQRMRASYSWVSMWSPLLLLQYPFLWLVSLVAFWRVQPKNARMFFLGMPLIGVLSIPVSYLLLEQAKWSLVPQFQPARAALFITAFAVILGAAAGVRAGLRGNWIESAAWLFIVFAIPSEARIFDLLGLNRPWEQRRVACCVLLAALGAAAIWLGRRKAWRPLLIVPAILPFLLLPGFGQVRNYRQIDVSKLRLLCAYARLNTLKSAIFAFPDAGETTDPGIFRAIALRPVYVDWKTGGQVNFYRSLAEEWWTRWQQTMTRPCTQDDLARFASYGIDYVVLPRARAFPDMAPAYQDSDFVVYKVGPIAPSKRTENSRALRSIRSRRLASS